MHGIGGRFLYFDKKEGYRVLNDKKVYDKVSQALRGDQKQIRQRIYAAEKKSGVPQEMKQYSEERYKQYSTYILGSLRQAGQSKPTRDVAELIRLSRIDLVTEDDDEPERAPVSRTLPTQCSLSSIRSGGTASTVAESLSSSTFNANVVDLEQSAEGKGEVEDAKHINEPNNLSNDHEPNIGISPSDPDLTENKSTNENDSNSTSSSMNGSGQSGTSMSWTRISDNNEETLRDSIRSSGSGGSLCAVTSSMLENLFADTDKLLSLE